MKAKNYDENQFQKLVLNEAFVEITQSKNNNWLAIFHEK